MLISYLPVIKQILKAKMIMKINLQVVGCLTDELYTVFPTGRYITLGTDFFTRSDHSPVSNMAAVIGRVGIAAACAIIYTS
jgi:hypothetical protein